MKPNLAPDTLKSAIRSCIPHLEHQNCALGNMRMQLMAEQPYEAVGFYFRKGVNLTFTYLDGLVGVVTHKHMFDTVWDSLNDSEIWGDACGYFFILPSDKEDCLQYTHYYIMIG